MPAIAALALAFLLSAPPAWPELRIEINRGAERAVPVAVVPFAVEPGAAPAVDVAGIVAADLASTGRFAPVAPKDLIQRPATAAQVNFDDWRQIGVDAVVVGRLKPGAAGGFVIEFDLLDVLRRQQLLSYRLPAEATGQRLAAHRAADLIYEKLTGTPGIFSTRIAYVTAMHRGGKADAFRLIVADADGADPQVVVESTEPIMSPSWSPDGRRLAYVSFENRQSEIYVQTLRTGARQRVSSRSGINGAPAWSPDGRLLALVLSRGEANPDIYTLDLGTQQLTRLTEQSSIETEPAWSPDGRSLYFTSDRGGGPQVYRVSPGGGPAQRVTFEGNYNARPRVSPDGKRVAVVHIDRGNYRIAVLELDRGALQVLTDGRLDESPSFAPNGETLIYATRDGGRGVLATVSVDGRIRSRISAPEGDVREPAWSPFRTN